MKRLEALRRMTTIVADTGDIDVIDEYRATDATTNPSLIKKAMGKAEYRDLVDEALAFASSSGGSEASRTEAFVDKLFVNFGRRILDVVPGRVSTEVPARLSFDVQGSLAKARRLIELYEIAGIERERVLIKLASTWEGIRAAETLEREGIRCNMTLLFSLPQAVACADAHVTLISPFVGRIYDWHVAAKGVKDIPIGEDPGVASVASIFAYYKANGIPTEIMGASFRKVEQVVALAGCDLLTISPELLEELATSEAKLERRLDPAKVKPGSVPRLNLDERAFRWHLNEDAMTTEKLAEGIRRFHADGEALAKVAREQVAAER